MSRRIEIELTSRTDEGGFTWRAAGAKQPKGTVASGLLPAGAAVGDVVRAEVESGLEGLEIVSVLARQEEADDRPSNRIELLEPRRGPDVLVSYASGRPRREDSEGSGGRRGRDAPNRGPRARRGPGDAPAEVRPGRGRREHPEGGAAHPRPRQAERTSRTARDGTARDGTARDSTARDAADQRGPARQARPERRDPALGRRERRPTVSTAHRNDLLATLGPQELPIAEQLLRGGIPAVRQALTEQYGAQPTDDGARANRDAVLGVAEKLLPRVNLAGWKDRAVSAQAAGKELRLRELRAVVTSARTMTLDDEARALSRALQETLEQRVRSLREEWISRMDKALGDGRVADAVRVSARAPEPATRLPAELAVRLADAASQVMTAELPAPQWIALLEAVVESPVRRNVKPRGIPEDDQAKDFARRAAGLVPELAKLLGLRIPPPPPRRRVSSGPGFIAVGGAGSARAR
ncbi:MAG: hypothetical protein ACRDXC_13380 [Acidimicrobiales bacterium]